MITLAEIWKLLSRIANDYGVLIYYKHNVYWKEIYFEFYSTDGLIEEYTNGKFWAGSGDSFENVQIGKNIYKIEFLLYKYGVR